MNKFRITYPNNKEVREYKSRTTKKDETKQILSIVETRYNQKGLVAKKSLPYKLEGMSESSKQWIEYTYDNENRIIGEVSPLLLNNTYQYQSGTYTNSVINTNNISNTTTTQEYNYLGQLEKSTDNGGDITYTYTAAGQPDTITSLNGKTIITYDEAGNRRSITEPNSGTQYTYYNGYGDITKNVDEKGTITTYTYASTGRLANILTTGADGNFEHIFITYETLNNASKGQLKTRINRLNNILSTAITTSYQYDNLGRPNKITESITELTGIKNFEKEFTYNNKGQIATVKYPSYDGTNRLELQNIYNSQGQLRTIKKGDKDLWRREMDNEYGQPLRVILGNSTGTMYYYNGNNQIKKIQSGTLSDTPVAPVDPGPRTLDATINGLTPGDLPSQSVGENIQKWVYEYNVKGLMSSRQDSLLMQKENFTYDNLDRLTNVNQQVIIPPRIYNVNSSISYDNQGNIQNKTDIGAYTYDNAKPNAISSITEPAPSLPSLFKPLTHNLNTETQDIQYNLHNKIEKITQGNKELKFYYNSSQDRIKAEYKENNIIQKTTYYIGNYECEVYPNGRIRELSYINTNTGHTIINLKDNNNNTPTDSLYYIFKDHLGSYDRITNQLGQIVETYSFDAWGNRRQALNWRGAPTATQIENYKFTRGFTGHEHMDKFQLINMNGRLYDPVIARFLSPDPYVANNTFTQDFNRYSYCRNNPLLYTDPSGEWALWDDLIVGGVGFATGYLTYGITNNDWGWNAVLSGTITAGTFMIGYYSGGATSAGGIANGFSGVEMQSFANVIGLNFAGKATASSVISSLMPSFGIPIGDKFTLGVSPGLAIGANGLVGGINFSGTYSNEENSISLGAGFFGNSYSFGGGFSIDGYGVSYYATHYGGAHSQWTGTLSLKANDVSFSIENDFLAFQGQDRWRTNAVELGIGNFVVGVNTYTNDPLNQYGEKDYDPNGTDMRGNKNKDGRGAWNNGQVLSSAAWIGYKNGNSITRLGYSHPIIQDRTQNPVHINGFFHLPFGYQNIYNKYDYFQQGLYSYYGKFNPNSLW